MRAHSFLLTTLLALAATAAQAQTPMRGGARRMELLFKDITLTPAQQAKVDSIQARYRSERGIGVHRAIHTSPDATVRIANDCTSFGIDRFVHKVEEVAIVRSVHA